MTTSKLSLERVAAIILFITAFLTPFFFIPVQSVPVDMAKTLLLVTGIVVSFSLYLVSIVKRGEIVLPSTKVMWSVLLIPGAFLASALLGDNPHMGLFGYNLEVGTWALVTLGFVLMFLVASLFKTRERIFYSFVGFLVSFVVVALLALGKFFFGTDSLSMNGVLGGNVFSPVGTISDLAVFFGVACVLSIIALEELVISKLIKSFLIGALVISLFSLSILGVGVVWVGTLVFSFIYLLYAFSRGASGRNLETSAGTERKISYSALAVLLVSLLFVFNPPISSSGERLGDAIPKKFNVVNLSVSPSLQATYQVTKPVLNESLLFGSGPNTFDVDWLKHKPVAVNGTIFWNTAFAYGLGLISSFFATTGIIGGGLWLLFIVFYTLLGMRAIFARGEDEVAHFLTSSSFIISLFLWLMFIVYVPSKAMFMLAFFFSGLFIASTKVAGVIAEKTILFRNSSKLAFIAVLLLVAVLVGNIGYAYASIKQSVSVLYYNKATIAATNGNIKGAHDYAVKAANLSNEDVYLSAVAQIGIAEANAILSDTTTPPAEARSNFQNTLRDTIAASQAAVQARPESYANWISLGQLYESLVPAPLAVEGAYESAKNAYTEAAKRNPQSPEPYYFMARLEVEHKDTEAARAFIAQALEKKNDYADAYYLLTQIEIAGNNLDEAIKNAETLTLLQPSNSGVFFQLGLLKYNKADYEGAGVALARALTISPDYANAKYFFGLTLDKVGQHDQAVLVFEDLLKSNPDNEELPIIIANIKAGKDPLAKTSTSATTPPISGKTSTAR